MALLRTTCPHCHTESVLFTSVAESPIKDRRFNVFFVCNYCSNAIIAIINAAERYISPHGQTSVLNPTIYRIENITPEIPKILSPSNTPSIISNYYTQAVDNLFRKNYDAAGMMFRKTLDATTKHLGESKGDLRSRIDNLETKRMITPDMKEWAHAIRLDGNNAAHEEDPFDEATCTILKSFTEMFLMYAFTLPKMVEDRRAPTP